MNAIVQTTKAPGADHVAGVSDVSFEVAKGETFVVMRMIGSGKSTLIRCLSRLTEATSASVHIDGAEIYQMTPMALRELRRHKLIKVLQNFGDRIAIMTDGRFVQVGTPSDQLLRPANDYVREYVKDAPRIKMVNYAADHR